MKPQLKHLFIISVCTLPHVGFAKSESGLNDSVCKPVYTTGGGVSYLSVLDALNPMPCMNKGGWWYVVGALTDEQKQKHSLQFNILRRTVYGADLSMGTLGFTFNHNNKEYYLWNVYPENMLQGVGCFHYKKADRKNFMVATADMYSPTCQSKGKLSKQNGTNVDYRFYHDESDYQHAPGEVGARYKLLADGQGIIKSSKTEEQLVNYHFEATVTDKRGLVPEAFGGFVGGFNLNGQQDLSWELAMPNLTVNSWGIHIEPAKAVLANDPIKQQIAFNGGGEDRVWFDRQTLLNDSYEQSNHPFAKALRSLDDINTGDLDKQLYRGTWMSFCFDKTELKDTCAVGVAFWQDGVNTEDMDSNRNAKVGFMNVFLADSGWSKKPMTQIGGVLTEVLEPRANHFPYQIKNVSSSVFESALTGRHYAQSVFIKVSPKSTVGRVLAPIAKTESKELTLRLDALSPLTENIMMTKGNSFYEGGGHVYLCDSDAPNASCEKVGSAFIEQMGYDD